jgi:methylamine---glutamate N-methyltransferase subunit B
MSTHTPTEIVIDADDGGRLNRHMRELVDAGTRQITLDNPRSRHNLCVGQHGPVTITVRGSVGYYCGGLNNGANIIVERSAGWGTGEAMSSGRIEVGGTCALGTGAGMRGGTIVVRGNCGPRTAANMKGGTLIVEGSVGYLAGFMTHAGDVIVCGDAGEALGDSLWAGRIYVAGKIAGLGADATVVDPDDEDLARVHSLLRGEGIDATFPFKKIAAEQKLWYFDARDPEAWLKI